MHITTQMRGCLLFLICLFPLFALSQVPTKDSRSDKRKPAASNTQIAAAIEVGKRVEQTLGRIGPNVPTGLALKSAVLTLETGTEVEGGFELNLLIFTISHKRKKGHTETIALTFQRDTLDEFATAAADLPGDDFLEQIKKAVAVASEVKTLPLNELSVKIEFVVVKDMQGSLSFKFLGGSASAGPSIDITKTSVNSLELILAKQHPTP